MERIANKPVNLLLEIHMFITPFNFSKVLDRFYRHSTYDIMIVFVSSFDGKDSFIIDNIVDNASIIDRITGNRICYYYFVKGEFNFDRRTYHIKTEEWAKYDGERKSVTIETADDICSCFHILRSELPAFIMINKATKKIKLLKIQQYEDFGRFLDSLNYLHIYMEDKQKILYKIEELDRHNIVREHERGKWTNAIHKFELEKANELLPGETDAALLDLKIQVNQKKIKKNERIEQRDKKRIGCLQEQLEFIENKAIENLNISLKTNEGEEIIKQLYKDNGYIASVSRIWDLVGSRCQKNSIRLEDLRNSVKNRGYDVFISYKSEDIKIANSVFEYLTEIGYKPFLSDVSLREVGYDQFSTVIGEVIDLCQNMVVIATKDYYLKTPYVNAEWNAFINDMNTGKKTNARLITILSPNITISALPLWLRCHESCTIENYRQKLGCFLYRT